MRKLRVLLCGFCLLVLCLQTIGCGGDNDMVRSDASVTPTLKTSKPKNKVLIDYADLEYLNYYQAKAKLEALGFDEEYYDGVDREYGKRQSIWPVKGEEDIPGQWGLAVWDHSVSFYDLEFGDYTNFDAVRSKAYRIMKALGRYGELLFTNEGYVKYMQKGISLQDDIPSSVVFDIDGFCVFK